MTITFPDEACVVECTCFKWRVEPKILGVTTIEFPTRLRTLHCYCYEFNVICVELPTTPRKEGIFSAEETIQNKKMEGICSDITPILGSSAGYRDKRSHICTIGSPWA